MAEEIIMTGKKACPNDSAALQRGIARHASASGQWLRIWRLLPAWQQRARAYAYSLALWHRSRMDTLMKTLGGASNG